MLINCSDEPFSASALETPWAIAQAELLQYVLFSVKNLALVNWGMIWLSPLTQGSVDMNIKKRKPLRVRKMGYG
jgi:hypothetical protein